MRSATTIYTAEGRQIIIPQHFHIHSSTTGGPITHDNGRKNPKKTTPCKARGPKIELRQFQFFPEPELEPEPQSCYAKRASTRANSTVEAVTAIELAPMLESVPNKESVPEYESQHSDRYNHPTVKRDR